MGTEPVGTQKSITHDEARKVLDEAWERSTKAYKVAKAEADAVYEQAKKVAPDKDARKRADEAHKAAIEAAKKVRDAITNEAQTVFTNVWTQKDKEAQEALAKTKERTELAQKAYKEAKDQAGIDHKAAKKKAVDAQARKDADAARKESEKKAKAVYDEAMKP
ncbi:MAG: hypothetical protein JW846_06505 [Dehalococcoidia bacterium]|nr:hypothetical protein [Dehalococcoidia bacterium]